MGDEDGMSEAQDRVGVVVATFRSGDVLPALLESLAEHEPHAPVLVVDDASPEGPPDTGDHPLVRLERNRGYAAACNRGYRELREREDLDYVAFLNPDVRLTGPSLSTLAGTMDSRPEVGIATGPVRTPDGQRLPSAWGPVSVRRVMAFAAGAETTRWRAAVGSMLSTRVPVSSASTVIDDLRVDGHVLGGTMIVRATCFDELGGFDEEYFLYWEDADLCRRARDADWQIRLLPCEPFVHAEVEGARLPEHQRWEWFSKGALRFGRRHLVPGQVRQLEAALALGRRLQRLRVRG